MGPLEKLNQCREIAQGKWNPLLEILTKLHFLLVGPLALNLTQEVIKILLLPSRCVNQMQHLKMEQLKNLARTSNLAFQISSRRTEYYSDGSGSKIFDQGWVGSICRCSGRKYFWCFYWQPRVKGCLEVPVLGIEAPQPLDSQPYAKTTRPWRPLISVCALIQSQIIYINNYPKRHSQANIQRKIFPWCFDFIHFWLLCFYITLAYHANSHRQVNPLEKKYFFSQSNKE